MRSLSGTYGLRLAAQPALALAPAAAAPARVLLRGERTRRGAARWTLHFAKPAPRGVGLAPRHCAARRRRRSSAPSAAANTRRSPRAKAASATCRARARLRRRRGHHFRPVADRRARDPRRLPASAPNRRCRSSTRSRRARTLEALPLIKQASVRKLYPDRIVIDIVERAPAALWQKDGELSAIAADGAVIDKADDGRYAALPFVVGEGANERARRVHRAARRLGRAQAEDRRRHIGRRPALEPQDALGRRRQAAGGRSAGGDGDAADAAAPVAHSRPRHSLASICACRARSSPACPKRRPPRAQRRRSRRRRGRHDVPSPSRPACGNCRRRNRPSCRCSTSARRRSSA